MSDFMVQYLVLVFLTACGALQVGAAYSRLRGLLFLPSPKASMLLGIVLIVGTFLWFFVSGPRSIPDTQGGLNGNNQAALFAIGATLAILFTFTVGTLVNLNLKGSSGSSGLDALQECNYLDALKGSLRTWWQRSKNWMRKSFSG